MTNLPTPEQFETFKKWRAKELAMAILGNTITYYPTDDEVLAAVAVYSFFCDVAEYVGQEMFGLWAAMQYQQYTSLASARKLQT